MSANKGKQFEARFKLDWEASMLDSTIDRIYDTMNGYKSISNVSDFICYKFPNIFYCELKTHKGASLPFKNITQYSKLREKVGIHGVRVGIILWLYEKDVVIYIPISTITQMKKDGKKSVGLKAIEEGYNIKIIPSEKLRIFMKSDYSCLCNLEDGE